MSKVKCGGEMPNWKRNRMANYPPPSPILPVTGRDIQSTSSLPFLVSTQKTFSYLTRPSKHSRSSLPSTRTLESFTVKITQHNSLDLHITYHIRIISCDVEPTNCMICSYTVNFMPLESCNRTQVSLQICFEYKSAYHETH